LTPGNAGRIPNNGIRKGVPPEAMRIFFTSPNLEDVWQAHFSQLGGQEYTSGHDAEAERANSHQLNSVCRHNLKPERPSPPGRQRDPHKPYR